MLELIPGWQPAVLPGTTAVEVRDRAGVPLPMLAEFLDQRVGHLVACRSTLMSLPPGWTESWPRARAYLPVPPVTAIR